MTIFAIAANENQATFRAVNVAVALPLRDHLIVAAFDLHIVEPTPAINNERFFVAALHMLWNATAGTDTREP